MAQALSFPSSKTLAKGTWMCSAPHPGSHPPQQSCALRLYCKAGNQAPDGALLVRSSLFKSMKSFCFAQVEVAAPYGKFPAARHPEGCVLVS